MIDPTERGWSVELKKAQERVRRSGTLSAARRKRNLLDAMKIKKGALKEAARTRDAHGIEEALTTLLSLRAEMAAIEMEQEQRADAALRRYARDCAMLVSRASAYM